MLIFRMLTPLDLRIAILIKLFNNMESVKCGTLNIDLSYEN